MNRLNVKVGVYILFITNTFHGHQKKLSRVIKQDSREVKVDVVIDGNLIKGYFVHYGEITKIYTKEEFPEMYL